MGVLTPYAANNRGKWSAAEFASVLICLVRLLWYYPNYSLNFHKKPFLLPSRWKWDNNAIVSNIESFRQ